MRSSYIVYKCKNCGYIRRSPEPILRFDDDEYHREAFEKEENHQKINEETKTRPCEKCKTFDEFEMAGWREHTNINDILPPEKIEPEDFILWLNKRIKIYNKFNKNYTEILHFLLENKEYLSIESVLHFWARYLINNSAIKDKEELPHILYFKILKQLVHIPVFDVQDYKIIFYKQCPGASLKYIDEEIFDLSGPEGAFQDHVNCKKLLMKIIEILENYKSSKLSNITEVFCAFSNGLVHNKEINLRTLKINKEIRELYAELQEYSKKWWICEGYLRAFFFSHELLCNYILYFINNNKSNIEKEYTEFKAHYTQSLTEIINFMNTHFDEFKKTQDNQHINQIHRIIWREKHRMYAIIPEIKNILNNPAAFSSSFIKSDYLNEIISCSNDVLDIPELDKYDLIFMKSSEDDVVDEKTKKILEGKRILLKTENFFRIMTWRILTIIIVIAIIIFIKDLFS